MSIPMLGSQYEQHCSINEYFPINPMTDHQGSARIESNPIMAMKRQRSDQIPDRLVQHDYHDHINDKPPGYISNKGIVGSGYCFSVSKTGLGAAGLSFPIKLHEMLNSVEDCEQSHIISWQPHGRCFIIHKSQEFEKQLLERFFGITKKSSFQRQLNMYGFKRISRGPDAGAYYHELFLRGKVFLAYQIRRKRIKGEGARAKANPAQEPNFFAMPWLPNKDGSTSEAKKASVVKNVHQAPVPADRNTSPADGQSSKFDHGNDSVSQTRCEAPVPSFDDEELSVVTPPCLDRYSYHLGGIWGRAFFPVDIVPPGRDQNALNGPPQTRPGIFGKMQIPVSSCRSHHSEYAYRAVQRSATWQHRGSWVPEAPKIPLYGRYEDATNAPPPPGPLDSHSRKVTLGSVSEKECGQSWFSSQQPEAGSDTLQEEGGSFETPVNQADTFSSRAIPDEVHDATASQVSLQPMEVLDDDVQDFTFQSPSQIFDEVNSNFSLDEVDVL